MTPAVRRTLALALCLGPGAAWAHAPIKGIDDFYNGILHPLFVPAHMIALITLGLLFGQQGAQKLQYAILGFLVSIVAGLIASGLYTPSGMEVPLLLGAMTVGLLVTLDHPLPTWLYWGLALLLGLLLGVDSSFETLRGSARAAALFGSGVGLYLLFLYVLVLAERFGKRQWQRIGLRILGSWAAASAFIVLSLLFAPQKDNQLPQPPAVSQLSDS